MNSLCSLDIISKYGENKNTILLFLDTLYRFSMCQ